MAMQHNINIVRRIFRRDMDEPKFQTLALKIDSERPVFVPIAIPANNRQRRTERFQVESDRGFANIAQMPNFVRLLRKIDNLRRQLVMGIGNNEYAHCFKQCAP